MKYKVLYTHQKQKKRKTWQDGYLSVGSNRMGSLYDESSMKIDSLFVKLDQLVEDVTIESDKFLIQIENKVDAKSTEVNKENKQYVVETALSSSIKQSLQSNKVFRPIFSRAGLKRVKNGVFSDRENNTSLDREHNHTKHEAYETYENKRVCHDYEKACIGNKALEKEHQLMSSELKLFSNNNRLSSNQPPMQLDSVHDQKRSSDDILKFFSSQQSEAETISVNNKDIFSSNEISHESENFESDNVGAYFEECFMDDEVDIGNTCFDMTNNCIEINRVNSLNKPRVTCSKEVLSFDRSKTLTSNVPPVKILPSTLETIEKKSKRLSKWSVFEETFDYDDNAKNSSNIDESFGNSKNSSNKDEIYSVQSSATDNHGSSKNDCIDTSGIHQQIIRSSKNNFVNPKRNNSSRLVFPYIEECLGKPTPRRCVRIPACFAGLQEYTQIMKGALEEHLNILLFQLACKYFAVLQTVDMTSFSDTNILTSHDVPNCKHNKPSKMRSVRKENKNKGRCFYACAKPKGQECGFFVWLDDVSVDSSNQTSGKRKINDARHANTVFSSANVQLYSGCKIIRKVSYYKRGDSKSKYCSRSKSMFLMLPFKLTSTFYNKDDIWIVSNEFDFKKSFIAKSVFYGPNQSCEVEIEPIYSILASDWPDNALCHAIQAFNASNEIACLENIDSSINPFDLPILNNLTTDSKNIPRSIYSTIGNPVLSVRDIMGIVDDMVSTFHLNKDQSTALQTISNMFTNEATDAITLIHGVFGSGKSYLLSVVVLFLVKLFEVIESKFNVKNKLRLLVASSTNVAVDRVLSSLLQLQFEDFVRVGSVKKISRPILPYSIHASENENQEVKELNELLRNEVSDFEKGYVRKALEQHKLGVNKRKLEETRVVGITCASCACPYVSNMRFQVQLLDECSQMTEATSLLPIGRFKCERLVLVGDPKQLPPTIQGSEGAHEMSLEQTLFERLQKQGREPVILRTQYRCHPKISSLCSNLFYNGVLYDGLSEDDREQIVENMPTLGFLDASSGKEKMESDGSYSNETEAGLVVSIVTSLLNLDVESSQIGVITQYRSQVHLIRHMLSHGIGHNNCKDVQVSTVDAFQGAEKEIILLSCVRTQNIGFIDCPRRTNVSLSRARRHLLVVGMYRLLKSNCVWGEVIRMCTRENTVYRDSKVFLTNLSNAKKS